MLGEKPEDLPKLECVGQSAKRSAQFTPAVNFGFGRTANSGALAMARKAECFCFWPS